MIKKEILQMRMGRDDGKVGIDEDFYLKNWWQLLLLLLIIFINIT